MPIYTLIGFGPADFDFPDGGGFSAGNRFQLTPDWSAPSDRLTFAVDDDDSSFEGDIGNDEIGDDATQDLTVTNVSGTTLATGRAYLETSYQFTDEFGASLDLYAIEVGGTLVGYIANGDVQPGNTYTVASVTNVTDSSVTFASITDQTYDQDTANTIVGTNDTDTLNGGADADIIDGGDGYDSVDGGDGADSLTGGDGKDTLLGEDGADTLIGGLDDDSLVGGSNNDSLDGGSDDDTIFGGYGHDTLDGGIGDDRLTGNSGNDVFIYSGGNDTITDFNTGNTGSLNDGSSLNNDFIDLSGYYENLSELYADFANDGVLDQDNLFDGKGRATDYSDNTSFAGGGLTFSGGSSDATFFTVENTGVTCFVAGTAIRTPFGDVAVESLKPGDLVTTKHHGAQKVRWIGTRHVSSSDMQTSKSLCPIRIQKGVFDNSNCLFLSRQHAIEIGSAGLAKAEHLSGLLKGVGPVQDFGCLTYIHLLFGRHEIVWAENVPCESFFPGPHALRMLPPRSRKSLARAVPGLHQASLSLSRADLPDEYRRRAAPLLSRKQAHLALLSHSRYKNKKKTNGRVPSAIAA